MEETKRSSLKLDIGAVRSTEAEAGAPKESYKALSEDHHFVEASKGTNDKKMVKSGDNLNDGADEKMLRAVVAEANEKAHLAKKDEVKFISGDRHNGDAKIDIGAVDKVFTGMTKEELMKYANDPFWVRLRWVFFILFWALWVAMLVGAVLIIISAPKCAAPKPLAWWKQGPLVDFKSLDEKNIHVVEKVKGKGVIYELPADETYFVKSKAEISDKIKELVNFYKENGVNLILDITPNFITGEHYLFKEALKDDARRSPFVWVNKPDEPSNWKSTVNGSAWHKVSENNYVLSQFGVNRYDLQLTDPIAKEEFKSVLEHLVSVGVTGFRLANAKNYIIDKDLKNEEIARDSLSTSHDDYNFWTHTHTTYQEGLGELLQEFANTVNTSTLGEGFLSVTEDLVRPEVFQVDGRIVVDVQIYGRFPQILAVEKSTESLFKSLSNVFQIIGDSTWVQWIYSLDKLNGIDGSAYNIFLSLLPGVQVLPCNVSLLSNLSEATFRHMENLRLSPSYMHGSFNIYKTSDAIGYTRIKSGNPGFFVVLNPSDAAIKANFSSAGLPDTMTVDWLSSNYNSTEISTKSKIETEQIPLSPYSAVVLTYVPVKN